MTEEKERGRKGASSTTEAFQLTCIVYQYINCSPSINCLQM